MKTIETISISKNRVAVDLIDNTTIQFVVWNLEKQKHNRLRDVLNTAFCLCSNFKEILKHLAINKFDAELEDIY